MSRFARAVIEYVTNATKARQDSEQVKKSVQEVGKAQQGIGQQVNQAAEKGAGGWVSAAAKIAGIAGTFYLIGSQIRDAFDFGLRAEKQQKILQDLTASAQKFADTLALRASGQIGGGGVADQINQVLLQAQQQIDQMTTAMQAELTANDRWYKRLMRDAPSDTDVLTRANMVQRQVTAAANREADRLRQEDERRQAEETRKRMEADKKAVNEMMKSRLSALDQVTAEEFDALDQIQKREMEARTKEELEYLALRKKTTIEFFEFRRQKIRDEQAKEQQDLQEQATKQAQILAKAYADALEKFNADVTRVIQQAVSAQQSAASGSLNGLSSSVNRLTQIVEARLRSTPTVLPAPSRR